MKINKNEHLFKKKYDHEKVLELRKKGYSYSQIEKELGMRPGVAHGIINRKKKSEYIFPVAFQYDFQKVLGLLEKKRSNTEIHKELNPNQDIGAFYKWKEKLSEAEKLQLKKFTKICKKGKLIDLKIERKFKYIETNPKEELPLGLSQNKTG